GTELLRQAEKYIMLRVLDNHWIEHIENMEFLKEGIGLRAYGQREPLIEYKREAYEMFQEMLSGIRRDITRFLMRLEIREERKSERTHTITNSPETKKTPVKVKKIGRNDPCPCGSGKKYKNCCGRDA
ncbi:MAG: SEC-C metal-binding domain-containing protein, partial [bacterium]